MSLNIKTSTGLLQISGQVTKENVVSALGYEPANVEIETTVENHISNTDAHITSDERTLWTENVENLNSHSSDTNIHITEAERTAWNEGIENFINTTYSLSKSGNTITLTGSDGSTTSVTDSDSNTDTKVTVNPYSDDAEYPIVLNPSVSGAPNTNTMGFKTGVTINPSTSTITASYFNGFITGGLKSGTTIGTAATAEGLYTTASGNYSHAEGYDTTASGNYSHAEGEDTTASNSHSHAEGYGATASGTYSHAEGYYTTASGIYSHASGTNTIANNFQYVVGKYNADTTAPTSTTDTTVSAGLFIVGIGTGSSTRSNGFRISPGGKVYGTGVFGTSGADYAEYFEWLDGNPNNEDRRGRFVTLDGGKIRYATSNDDYILGVVSANPSVAGDIQSESWHDMYLKDVFGSKIVEVVEIEETTDENGEIIPAHIERRWVLNPDYNPNAKYISREERPEWSAIGIVGKLVVVDDGTCQVNNYCYPNVDGIATASQDKTNYRVMERLDDTHIRIFIR